MSIKDIAARAGVSPSTVSRVLNNPTHRCSTTGLRDRIWQIAREEHYLPNEAARTLKLGSGSSEKAWRIDALLTRSPRQSDDAFFGELLRTVETETHRQRCVLANVWRLSALSGARGVRRGAIERELSRILEPNEDRADGLVVIGKCEPHALARLRDAYGRRVVSIGRNSVNYLVDEVLCDGEEVAHLATKYLIDLGHRRIGYVGDCKNESRYRGYRKALEAHGLELDVRDVIECNHTEAAGYRAMERLMQREDAPTGLFCATDAVAIGLLRCREQFQGRYYAPSVVSSDDVEAAQFCTPALTTVHLPCRDMGRYALRLLVDRIGGGHSDSVRLELRGRLVERDSCASPAEATGYSYVI